MLFMKKIKTTLLCLLGLVVLPLAGCSKGNPEIKFDSKTIEGLIGNTAKKYVENFDAGKFASNCKLDNAVTCKHDELLNAFKLAFDGHLPEAVGERKYLGYFGDVEIARTLNESETNNFDFLNNIGLVGSSYDPDEVMDMNDTQLYVERLYKYFGNNQKDDFARAVNSDFYFEDTDDLNWKFNESKSLSKIIGEKEVMKNVEELYLQMEKDNYEPTVSNLDKYYFGEEKYNPLSDSYYLDTLDTIKNLDNIDDLVKYEAMLQNTVSFNLFGFQLNDIGALSKSENYTVSLANNIMNIGEIASVSSEDVYVASLESKINEYTVLLEKYTPLEDSEVDEYIDSYKKLVDYVRDCFFEYASEYLDSYGYTYLYDLFNMINSIGAEYNAEDFFGATSKADYCFASIPEVVAGYFVAFLILDNDLTFEEVRNFSYLSFVVGSCKLLAKIDQNGLDAYTFFYLSQFTIMGYYQNTDNYDNTYNYLSNAVDEIKEEYASVIRKNKTLSAKGKLALIDKIKKIEYTVMLTNSDGTYVDFSKLFNHKYSDSILQAYLNNKNFVAKELLRYSIEKKYVQEAYIYHYNLFVSNAFYTRVSNCIDIPCGAALFVGADYSKVIEEEILGKIGIVIGHELSHSIDPDGIYYDADGNYVASSIVPAGDLGIYDEAKEKLIEFYSIETSTEVMQDGGDVIAEAVADNFGLQVIVSYLENKESFDFGKFFIYLARNFVAKGTWANMQYHIDDDEHPFGAERVNCMFRNSSKFQEVFKFQEGDAMYRAAEDIIKIL